ncbi:hypothetical protein LSCM1_07394 [Leishmania martiniquensis]|uniref:C3H1-type domain-containing protein n=1 Tax=Leishmania martiniquensis TaxID=1580590 RepID=A0A836H5Z5_9TRYP|nr:hypothetical protein LSCM1_07394 [Leishmania martiniquensis]
MYPLFPACSCLSALLIKYLITAACGRRKSRLAVLSPVLLSQMFASYPVLQPMGAVPMAVIYSQSYSPHGAVSYPALGYRSMLSGYSVAPLMMSAGSAPYPVSAYLGHSATPVCFVMDAANSAAPIAVAADATSACATPTAKLAHSGSGNSLSTQSYCSGGETASLLSHSAASSTFKQRPQHDVNVWGFALVDHLHPLLQRIPVPPSCVQEVTLGISLYDNDVTSSSTRPCKSSVCILHAQGLGCEEGARCRCFHVSHPYLMQCRATSESLCCALHNCYYSQEMLSANCAPHVSGRCYALSLDDASKFQQNGDKPYLIDLSLLNLSLTVGLETLPCVNGLYVVSWKKHVCHLNMDGRCKWTKDCGHIHVCRQLAKFLQDAETLSIVKALQEKTTSKSSAELYRDIILSENTLRYVRSAAALSLVAALLESRDVVALKALARAKCALLSCQIEALQKLGIALSCSDLACSVTVSPKIRALLSPAIKK